MAGYPSVTDNWTTAFISTLEASKKSLTDNIYKVTPLSAVMLKKGRMKSQAGGTYITENVSYDINNTVKKMASATDTISINRNEKRTKARWTWGYFAGSVVRYYNEEKENTGAFEIRNIINDELTDVENALKDDFETRLFDATDGLQLALPYTATWSSTQAFGGFDPTAGNQDFWRNGCASRTGSSFAANWDSWFIDSDLAIENEKCAADLIVTTDTIWKYYKTECLGMKSITYDTYLADLGFKSIEYEGRPLVHSPKCPAGNLYFIDTNHLRITYNPLAWFDHTEWKPQQNSLNYAMQVICAWVLTSDKRKAHYTNTLINTA